MSEVPKAVDGEVTIKPSATSMIAESVEEVVMKSLVQCEVTKAIERELAEPPEAQYIHSIFP